MLMKPHDLKRGMYPIFMIAMLALRLFFWISPSHETQMIGSYLWPSIVAAMALLMACRLRGMSKSGIVSICLALWFWVSCVLNGDYYLTYNLHFIVGVTLTFGLGFPLFFTLEASEKGRWFDAVSGFYVGAMVILAGLGVYVVLTASSIGTPLSENAIKVTKGRLSVFGMHPNEIASAMSLGLFLAIRLILKTKHIAWKLVYGLGGCILCLAIAFTVSRTSILISAAGVSVAVFLWCMARLAKRKLLVRVAVSGTAMAAVLILLSGMMLGNIFSLPQKLPGIVAGLAEEAQETPATALAPAPTAAPTAEQTAAPTADPTEAPKKKAQIAVRDIMDDLGTFSARTEIWQAGLQYIKDRPITLLIGSADSDVARVPNRYLGRNVYHMHNTWMEMLLLTGVPGSLMYLFLILSVLWAGFRLLRAKGQAVHMQYLAIVPVFPLINGLMEIYPCVSGNVVDIMFFIVCGALISAAEGQKSGATK